MTPNQVISHWGHTWLSLAAWQAPLNVSLRYRVRPTNQRRLGTAHCARRVATVYLTGHLAEDLSTVLHELAHLAAPINADHGPRWRELYVAASAEALAADASVFETETSILDLDRQVVTVAHDWLRRSGQLAVLTAIGVVP
jgi:hypothetical protein